MNTLTVAQVAELLKTTEESVLTLIRTAKLPASNVCSKPGAIRPRWRILETDLAMYLMHNRYASPIASTKPKRAKRTVSKDYFAELGNVKK